jgi:hypothetical protein
MRSVEQPNFVPLLPRKMALPKGREEAGTTADVNDPIQQLAKSVELLAAAISRMNFTNELS